ncbi:MAG: S8 family serine peptidase [Cyclobacteriaceae bacterium]
MKSQFLLRILPLCILVLVGCKSDDSVPPDATLDFGDIWVDPAFEDSFVDETVVVWFTDQFLKDAESYSSRQSEFGDRIAMRSTVLSELKRLSTESHNAAQDAIDELITAGLISEFKSHWIINGFSCKLAEGGIEGLVKLPGVDKIFKKLFADPGDNSSFGPEFITAFDGAFFTPPSFEKTTWNLKKLKVIDVWESENVTGEGVLNIIHDFGFKLDIPALSDNIYRNPGEIAGNGIDDDENGHVDDYHGFNFDANSSLVNNPRLDGTDFNHGSAVASMICGRIASDTAVGVAPNAQWSPVRGFANFEEMVEWAIEQEADTYTMSFSVPNMMEFRTHWRKVIEHGTYSGIFFISGAGNFGNPANANFAPVPVQMRVPESIPAVFGVAGVDSLLNRPVFSSKGPVVWDTDYYSEGQVDKPDFATFNDGLDYVDIFEGKLTRDVRGNSFAGPQLAGVISLMLSKDKTLTPWGARQLLIDNAVDVLSEGYDNQSGYGLIDALATVQDVN